MKKASIGLVAVLAVSFAMFSAFTPAQSGDWFRYLQDENVSNFVSLDLFQVSADYEVTTSYAPGELIGETAPCQEAVEQLYVCALKVTNVSGNLDDTEIATEYQFADPTSEDIIFRDFTIE